MMVLTMMLFLGCVEGIILFSRSAVPGSSTTTTQGKQNDPTRPSPETGRALRAQPGRVQAARLEFIDPFLESLGWDVRNVQGRGEQRILPLHQKLAAADKYTSARPGVSLPNARGHRPPDRRAGVRVATKGVPGGKAGAGYGLTEEEIAVVAGQE
jgi:hypothetical protein